LSWYGGTFVGTSCVFFVLNKAGSSIRIPKKEITGVGLLALSVWLSMVLEFWSAKLVPITVFQPIFLVGEAILPTIIGLWIFKELGSSKNKDSEKNSLANKNQEINTLTNKDKLALLLGIIGIVFICTNYH
jgi:hypothetical protein